MFNRSFECRRVRVLVWALCVVALMCGAYSRGGESAALRYTAAEAQDSLARELREAVERGDTSGVVALVVDRTGVKYQASAGYASVVETRPMPEDAIFLIASMTKPITSVAVMMLIEEGRLGLDDPVSKYLAGFDNLRVITSFNEQTGVYATRAAKRTMTIRHLLAHTSGIGYGFSSPIVKKLTESSHKNEWELPLLSEPGEAWHYGASTVVLGMIVEKISGQSLEDFFQQRIFRPLGMRDTSYAVPVDKQALVASVTRRVDGMVQEVPRHNPIPSVPAAPFFGDGGLYSTAQDYGRFMQMLLNGGRLGSVRIIRAETLFLMARNSIGSRFVELQPAADPSLAEAFPLGAGRDKFGLGFQIASQDPRYVGYRSPNSLSWAGIYNTEFWVDPIKHIGGVMLMQLLPFYDDRAIRTFRDFERSVYRALR